MPDFIVHRSTNSKIKVTAEDAQKAEELARADKGQVVDHSGSFRVETVREAPDKQDMMRNKPSPAKPSPGTGSTTASRG